MNSSDPTFVILSVCGVAAIVGILIVLTAFLVIRVMKGSVFGLGMMAMKIFTEPKEDIADSEIRAYSATKPRDLRAEARAVDFDAQVARYSGKPVTPTTPANNPNTISAQSAPPLAAPPASPLARAPRPRRPHKEHEEDVDFLEDFLDD